MAKVLEPQLQLQHQSFQWISFGFPENWNTRFFLEGSLSNCCFTFPSHSSMQSSKITLCRLHFLCTEGPSLSNHFLNLCATNSIILVIILMKSLASRVGPPGVWKVSHDSPEPARQKSNFNMEIIAHTLGGWFWGFNGIINMNWSTGADGKYSVCVWHYCYFELLISPLRSFWSHFIWLESIWYSGKDTEYGETHPRVLIPALLTCWLCDLAWVTLLSLFLHL